MVELTNTLSRRRERVAPRERGVVRMYACGPTVYRRAHIGNLRTFLLTDVIRRALEYLGLEVRSVMNITDIGHMTDEVTDEGRDRMLLAAEDEGLSPEEISERYTQSFFADLAALNASPADSYPKASDHIEDAAELVAKLVERGHGYVSGDNVYFDVTTFPAYGRLSGQSLDAMRAGHRLRATDSAKRHHQDFLLWRGAGPRRQVVFDSPWGPGFPGWHIECSAMSLRHLGEWIDLHTGGVDLRFPHHENEIAQSEGAVGHPVVSLWVHGEHLLTSDTKMAKSAGNVVTLPDLADRAPDPLAFRHLCFTSRHRSPLGFSAEALAASHTALRRVRERLASLAPAPVTPPVDDPAVQALELDERARSHHESFLAAVGDNLDLPRALIALSDLLADGDVDPSTRVMLAASWDRVLGLGLVASPELDPGTEERVRRRQEAREAGDFEAADAIRDELLRGGLELIDTPQGTRWVRRP